jgi:hypothetical protein
MEMNLQDTLFTLEEQFWKSDVDFYRDNLADAAVMVFPDPTGVLIKDEIFDTLTRHPRWANVQLEEHRVVQLDDGAAVVTYKATAQREGELTRYIARASSAYVRDRDAWKLAFHQQTPLTGPEGSV